MKMRYLFAVGGLLLLAACNPGQDSGAAKKAVYVKPSVDKNGRLRKGYVRMPVSGSKNAIKSQNSSRYYYHTRGRYRRK